jgi:hypothetical protein
LIGCVQFILPALILFNITATEHCIKAQAMFTADVARAEK